MENFSNDMSDRIMYFIVNVIKLEKDLCRNFSGRHIFGQLFRSATSAGANYEESRAGESKADFVHKMQIVLKELRESRFWIRLVVEIKRGSKEDEILKFLLGESSELSRIIAKSIVTAKSKMK